MSSYFQDVACTCWEPDILKASVGLHRKASGLWDNQTVQKNLEVAEAQEAGPPVPCRQQPEHFTAGLLAPYS